MKYASQRVALVYFAGAMALLVVQLLFGLLAAAVYAMPNFLAEVMPFNILRMIHTNALVVWLLMGFFGAAYYLVPEEAERDTESPLRPRWVWSMRSSLAPCASCRRTIPGPPPSTSPPP